MYISGNVNILLFCLSFLTFCLSPFLFTGFMAGFTTQDTDDLKFAYFEFTATMDQLAPKDDKGKVLGVAESFVRHIQSYPECLSSCDCSHIYQTTPYAWAWYRSETALEFGFYQGITIAFPVAFGVLLYATNNIFISLFAIIAVVRLAQ